MHTFNIFDDGVEDAPSRRRFAFLLREMLASRLTLDNLPPLEGLRGFGEATQILLTQYFDGGVFKIADTALTLLLADPALADALFSATPTDAMPPILRGLRPSELAMLRPVSHLDDARLIQDLGISMVVAKPGTGKSLWAIGVAHEVGQRLPVLYVAAEAESSLHDRQLAIARARGVPMPEQVYTITHPVNLRLPEQVLGLTDYARDIGARLVVFDTWARCTAGADENSVRDVQPIFNALEQFKVEVGCGILIVHHTRKDSAVYRGSSAMEGALDNLYVMTEDNGLIRLKATKTRDSRKPDVKCFRLVQFQTRLHPETGDPVYAPALLPASQVIVEEEATPKRVDGNPRKVLEVLDAYDEGLTVKQIEEMAEVPHGSFYRLVNPLVEKGYVAKQANSHKDVRYSLTEAGRDALA